MPQTTPEMELWSRAGELTTFDQTPTSSLVLALVRDGTAYRPDAVL